MQNLNSKLKTSPRHRCYNSSLAKKEDVNELLQEATELSNMIAAGVIKLKSS